MSNSTSEAAKAKHQVTTKDGRIDVTDLAVAAQAKVDAIPEWLRSGPEAAVKHVEGAANGLSKGALALIQELAGAVAALRDLVISSGQ